MIVGGVNAALVASSVWTNLTRTLTGFGGAIQNNNDLVHQSLAASTNVDLRPGVNQQIECAVGNESAAGGPTYAFYDGVTFRATRPMLAGGDVQIGKGNSAFGPALMNINAGNAVFYNVAGWKWTT